MIQFDSGGLLLQDSSELPTVPEHIPVLYADFETSSGDPSLSATNPWHDCSAIGAAVAFGYQSPIWFIPKELLVTGWWRDVLRATEVWANHSIKYDAHVSGNDVSNSPTCRLRCTLTGAKLLDSDRIFKGGYGLDVLSKEWLGTDIFRYEWAMTPYLASARNKDYGRVPIEILAEYACMDVDTNRRLDQYIENRMPEESKDVWNTEQKFTSLLLKMERRGVRVDPQQVKLKQLEVLKNLIILDAELDHLVGRAFSPSSSNDCFDVLCNQYGLPVLEWTDETKNKTGVSNPSFSAEVLEQYLVHPDAPVEVIKKMIDYRSLKTFNGLFLEAWQDIQKNGVMHPNYNQMVRTGRLSCSEPNMQQLDMFAKELIIPPPGYGIVVSDASQIEFRIIVHYIGNRRCIDAYNADPWTDFHQWMADMAGMARRPAKTMNFMMGYGGGKKKTVSTMAMNKDVVGDIIERVKAAVEDPTERQAAIKRMCEQRGLEVYTGYHAALPELKPTQRMASGTAVNRGYVRNWYGRRRHLDARFAHKAFNSLCQSTAGDICKERMVALDAEIPEFEINTQVHDEVVGYAPLEVLRDPDERLLRRIVNVLCDVERPLTVPVRWTIGWSEAHWADAKSEEHERKFA